MFPVSEAKLVRRDQLNGSDSESEREIDEALNAELQAKLRAKLASAFDYSFSEPLVVPTASTEDVTMATDEPAEEEEEEFEFRLFATGSSTQPTKIVLESDAPIKLGDGKVLMPDRPISYYLAERATGEAKKRFEEAAVSYDDVMGYAQQRWWGMEQPWKIIARIPASGNLLSKGTKIVAIKQDTDVKKKRNRPCKKSRIKKHIKEREERKKKEEEERKLLSKEEHLKEKNKRMNALKKARRKAKEKAAKEAKAAGQPAVVVAGENNEK